MLCALIMAGGRGTRFWPLSTEDKPKQFLALVSEKTMIKMTVDRIKPIIPIDRIFVCTGQKYKDILRQQLPELNDRNIIIEPEGRNTAPCIALSAMIINKYYKNSTMIVLPSDHLIRDEEKFRSIVKSGEEFIKEHKETIVTLGMKPTRPETGYGYIKITDKEEKVNDNVIVKVDAFVEKPNIELAEKYLRSGKFLWNGGMFIWNTTAILCMIKKYIPNTYEALKELECVSSDKIQKIINLNYSKTDCISIDYAILEKSDHIYVIPSEIGWDDVGSWEAVERYRKSDEYNNIHIGDVSGNENKNNLIVSCNNKVIINDISDIYVLENDGYIIIGKKENISRVKKIKDNLK